MSGCIFSYENFYIYIYIFILNFFRYIDLEENLDDTCSEMREIRGKMTKMLNNMREGQPELEKEDSKFGGRRKTILKKRLTLKEEPRKEFKAMVYWEFHINNLS